MFVMSDNVFKSDWCIKELQAAVEYKCNIILVTKEGSRWVHACADNDVVTRLPCFVRIRCAGLTSRSSDDTLCDQSWQSPILRLRNPMRLRCLMNCSQLPACVHVLQVEG